MPSNGRRYSCVGDGRHRVVELEGRLVRDSLGSSGLVEVKPVEMRFSSNEAAWAELERDYFDRREVEVGLHRGTKRSQPLWAKELDRCSFARGDEPVLP